MQEYLSEWTVGNLGASSQSCIKRDLKVHATAPLYCPSGTKIQKLQYFGLQRDGAKKGDNVCPASIEDTNDEQEALKLDLDP